MSGPRTSLTPDDGQSNQAQHDAILEQVEAYALGALDRVDAGIVEQHIRWCPQCRDEVEAVRRVVDLLPLAVPYVDSPPPDVKARLLERVASESRSEPYHWTGLHQRDEPEPARSPSAQRRASRTDNADGTIGSDARSWQRFVPPAVIAPLAIALIVVGAWANSMRLELEDQEQVETIANQEVLNQIVANGGDVRLYSMEPQCTDCGGRGRLGVDVADSVGVVVAWDLNPEQKHEVWCVNKKGDRKMVSTLDVDAEGGAMQAFAFPDDNMADYTEVYIAQTDGEATYMTNLTQDIIEPSATPDT